MEEERKKSAHLSEEQKRRLFQLMQKHEELRKAKFSPSFTTRDAQKQWQQIAETLNGIVGPNKSWKKWRMTWNDLKKQHKKKGCRSQTKKTLLSTEHLLGINFPKIESDFSNGGSDLSNTSAYDGQSLKFDCADIKQEELFITDIPKNRLTPDLEPDGISERKLALKNDYYTKKLELMERDTNARERIAAALEKLATKNFLPKKL